MRFSRTISCQFSLLLIATILSIPVIVAAAEKEPLVLMPIRATGVDKAYNIPMETALVEGLSNRYKVFSGERVTEKVREIFKKVSQDTAVGKECDATVCLQNVAIEFQSELIAMVTILKTGSNYFLTINVKNVLEDSVVFSKSETCESCNEIQVIQRLKEMVGGTPVKQSPSMQVQTGRLKVDSTPSDADVLISDSRGRPAFKGKTPLEANLTPGQYKLRLTKKNYQPLERMAKIEPRGTTTIRRSAAVLPKMKGKLKVTSKPEGAVANVIGSGSRRATTMITPFTVELDFGKYRIEISRKGYSSVKGEVEVPPGGVVEYGVEKATLKKQEGKVSVSSEPMVDGAEVFVDGKSRGKVPAEFILPSGRHSIRVESEYMKGTKSIVVEDESTMSVNVPVTGKFNIIAKRGGITVGEMKIGPSDSWAPLSDLYFPVFGLEYDILQGYGREPSPAHLSFSYSYGTLKAKTAAGDKFSLGIGSVGLGIRYDSNEPGGLYFGGSYVMLQLDYTFTNSYGTSSNEKTDGNVFAGEVGYLLNVYENMSLGVSFTQSNSADITLLGNQSGISFSKLGGMFTYEW